MKIIIDADACPRAIKEIVYRAAEKESISLILVANTHIRTPPLPLFKSISVPAGFNEADDKIVELTTKGDLIITADIPLADRVIKQGGYALDPRGEFLTESNIGARLTVRNFMHELRSDGVNTGGPSSISQRDRQVFASELQKFLKSGHIS